MKGSFPIILVSSEVQRLKPECSVQTAAEERGQTILRNDPLPKEKKFPRPYSLQGFIRGRAGGLKSDQRDWRVRRSLEGTAIPLKPHAGILSKPIREPDVHPRHLGTTGLTKAEAGGELPGPPE